jgi:mitochondrial fission protein ELM1
LANPSRYLEDQTAWVFSDGKAGHEAQCLGVVEALGLKAEMKRVNPTGVAKWLAPWGPVARQEAFGTEGSRFAPPWPGFAFATGRATIPYIRALKRRAGLATYTVILMDPRTGSKSADLIWVPEHDRLSGGNVVRTLTAPHRFSRARIEALRAEVPAAIAALPHPRIACLIGGPNGDYRYTADDESRLARSLEALARAGAGLMVTASRRTPEGFIDRLRTAIDGAPALIWDGSGHNPYPDFLADADHFVITADSVSMVCEAAATGRPISIFSPTGGSAKFNRFHSALAAYGATRPLSADGRLGTWSYEPLHSAEVIAADIARRWRRRVEMFPGLMA